MDLEIDLVLWLVSMVIFGFYVGAYTALEILSCSRFDKPAEENGREPHFIDRLFDSPVYAGLSLGAGRALALALALIASFRFASAHLSGINLRLPLSTPVFVVLSLLVPLLLFKTAAIKNPEKFVGASRFVIYPISFLIKPLVIVVGGAIRRVSPRLLEWFAFRIIPLKQKIEIFGKENGFLEEEEREIMSSIFDFGDTKVREVMVPRIDIVAVNLNTDKKEALKTIIDAGHSRIPVYEQTMDRIVGIVYAKDLLNRIVAGVDFSLAEISREPFFVPESKKIDDLLTEFKKRKKHLAIVVDEYGGTAGLITLEDVLEEIVGDIQDEFDTEEELVKKLDEDTAICNAKVHLDELNERFGLSLPVGSVDSLGGFLYEMIGKVPRVGEVFRHQGIEYEILSVLRQRIDKVLVKGLKSYEKRIGNHFS